MNYDYDQDIYEYVEISTLFASGEDGVVRLMETIILARDFAQSAYMEASYDDHVPFCPPNEYNKCIGKTDILDS